MKIRILNLLLILTSLTGYLEWGGGNNSFLFQVEAEVIIKLFTEPSAIVHPFILIPLTGQIILLVAVFQKKPSKKLSYTGIVCLGLLLGFMLIISFVSLNFKILASTIPFWVVVVLVIREYRIEAAK